MLWPNLNQLQFSSLVTQAQANMYLTTALYPYKQSAYICTYAYTYIRCECVYFSVTSTRAAPCWT